MNNKYNNLKKCNVSFQEVLSATYFPITFKKRSLYRGGTTGKYK